MKKVIISLTVFHFLLISACFSPVELSAAPYYEGKVVTIVLGHAPGGGVDRMARLLAKDLPKYIPGKPSIVVKTMLGAGGLVAANYVYQAKPDGFTIGSLSRSLGTSQIMKENGVRYDFPKYSWIGSVASEPTALFVRANLPQDILDEFLRYSSM